MRAGARDSIVHEGEELSIMGFDFNKVNEQMHPEKRKSLTTKIFKYIGVVIFTIIIFYTNYL